jgi:hypothetical protein
MEGLTKMRRYPYITSQYVEDQEGQVHYKEDLLVQFIAGVSMDFVIMRCGFAYCCKVLEVHDDASAHQDVHDLYCNASVCCEEHI